MYYSLFYQTKYVQKSKFNEYNDDKVDDDHGDNDVLRMIMMLIMMVLNLAKTNDKDLIFASGPTNLLVLKLFSNQSKKYLKILEIIF